jgi:hypothetical protein
VTYKGDKDNPFASAGEPAGDFDEMVYGRVDAPESGRVVARPISIMEIWPDVKQPRRAIPSAIRRIWNGTPADIPGLLGEWNVALAEEGHEINVLPVLDGIAELPDEDETPDETDSHAWRVRVMLNEYMSLVRLAASIDKDGLIHPITVVRSGDRYTIESGERRWLAYHLLAMYRGGKYFRIPAVVFDKLDVWRQAAENTRREDLNAIDRARGLALLLMDMYPEEDFDRFEDLVLPGECDRVFYAQARSLRVKRGFGEMVRRATGMTSNDMISRYRTLLEMPDELWTEADDNNWSEFKTRLKLDRIAGTNRAGQQTKHQPERGYTSPTGDVSPQKQAESGDSEPVGQFEDEPRQPWPPPSAAAREADEWQEEPPAEDEWRGDQEQEAEPFVMQEFPAAREMLRRIAGSKGVSVAQQAAAEQFLKLRESDISSMVDTDSEWADDEITGKAEVIRLLLEAEYGDFVAFVEWCQEIIREAASES